jgi:hypothetical protein
MCFHCKFVLTLHTKLWGFEVLLDHVYERGHKEEHLYGALNSSLHLSYSDCFLQILHTIQINNLASLEENIVPQTTHYKLWWGVLRATIMTKIKYISLGPLHTWDWEPVTIALLAFSLVEKVEPVQIHFTLMLERPIEYVNARWM